MRAALDELHYAAPDAVSTELDAVLAEFPALRADRGRLGSGADVLLLRGPGDAYVAIPQLYPRAPLEGVVNGKMQPLRSLRAAALFISAASPRSPAVPPKPAPPPPLAHEFRPVPHAGAPASVPPGIPARPPKDLPAVPPKAPVSGPVPGSGPPRPPKMPAAPFNGISTSSRGLHFENRPLTYYKDIPVGPGASYDTPGTSDSPNGMRGPPGIFSPDPLRNPPGHQNSPGALYNSPGALYNSPGALYNSPGALYNSPNGLGASSDRLNASMAPGYNSRDSPGSFSFGRPAYTEPHNELHSPRAVPPANLPSQQPRVERPTPVDLMNSVTVSAESSERRVVLEELAQKVDVHAELARGNADLDELESQLATIRADLTARKQQHEINIRELESATAAARKVKSQADSLLVPPELDDLVAVRDRPVEEAKAADRAISDLLRLLAKALDAGSIELHLYLRLVRQYAREQFGHRYLLQLPPDRPPKA